MASWAPVTGTGVGLFMQSLVWFDTVFGWVASLILVAVLSGLAKKDE